ncbi:putative phd transcription [Erysiphe neolycopersici]|uniref:Putative phd transcription n=1 Tax=Erysiphe neolycopersici TaxID=212602 RepID=A0A420HS57_9PEZI|nr:putative phd transcription [Erysiphe neolycopersici]
MDDEQGQQNLNLATNTDIQPISISLVLNDTSLVSVDSASDVSVNSDVEFTAADLSASPFAIITNNAPDFKFKYPEAKPTPPDEDDAVWNRTFNAADSRLYNKNGKNAAISKKFRSSGETYALALQVLAENKRKYFAGIAQNKISHRSSEGTLIPNTIPAPRNSKSPRPSSLTSTSKALASSGSADLASHLQMTQMSISEKVKAEGGRNRKASSIALVSNQTTQAYSNISQNKPDKEVTKKSTPTPIRKPGPKSSSKASSKKLKKDDPSKSLETDPQLKNASQSDSEYSHDGVEYCICRGPDDHGIMVNCEGPCKDWYHCSCVGINVEDAKELLDRYVCPKCSSDDFLTTYKPMCRYHNVSGCRKAAQIGLKPNPSMYCSEQHRRDFWEYIIGKLRLGDSSSIIGILSQAEASSLAKICNDRSEWQSLGNEPKLEFQNINNQNGLVGLDYVTPEEAGRIEWIHAQKIILKDKIELVRAQKELLIMIHEYCKSVASHPKLEVKDFCGYDNRLAMNEAQFLRWKNTEEGIKAFETGTIGPQTKKSISLGTPTAYPEEAQLNDPYLGPINNINTTTSTFNNTAEVVHELQGLCLKPRKKCKHNGWRDIHCGDYQLMISNYEEDMARLQYEEDEIIKEAELREATKDYYAHNVTIQHF